MPKSKRNKIVHLTQVKKKGKDHREDLTKQVEQYCAQFRRLYIFDFDQAKSDRIMNLRLKLKQYGRIFAGKNTIVTTTLKSFGSKTNTNFEELIEQISGHRGLLFTDLEQAKLMDILDKGQSEFCKKLIGYAQISPETKPMDVDDAVEPDKSENKEKKKKKPKKTMVKFVKL